MGTRQEKDPRKKNRRDVEMERERFSSLQLNDISKERNNHFATILAFSKMISL